MFYRSFAGVLQTYRQFFRFILKRGGVFPILPSMKRGMLIGYESLVNKGTEAVLAGCGSGQITARDMHFFPASVRSFSGVADRMSILTIL